MEFCHRDRDRQCPKPCDGIRHDRTDAHSDCHTDFDGYTDTDIDGYTDTGIDGYRDCHTDFDGISDCDAHSDCHTDFNGYTDTHIDANQGSRVAERHTVGEEFRQSESGEGQKRNADAQQSGQEGIADRLREPDDDGPGDQPAGIWVSGESHELPRAAAAEGKVQAQRAIRSGIAGCDVLRGNHL